MYPPEIQTSTTKEREDFITRRYLCISNCENCGLCIIFKGRDVLTVFKDYIEGKRPFEDIIKEYR